MLTTPSARRAFAYLLVLTGLVATALVALLLWQFPVLKQAVWWACQDLLAALGGLIPAAALVLPALVFLVALLRGAWALAVQLGHTRRLTRDLGAHRVRLSPTLELLSQEIGLVDSVVLIDDQAVFTFTEGLIWPRVWLSTGMVELLEADELAAVLRHECYHLQQRDPLRVLISRSLAEALFFLPLAGALRDAYLLAKEVDADQASGADDSLARALLKVMRSGASLPPEASLAAIGQMDVTMARIEQLVREGPDRRVAIPWRPLAISLFLGMVLVTSTYVASARAASPLQGGECGYSTQGELETPIDYTPAEFETR